MTLIKSKFFLLCLLLLARPTLHAYDIPGYTPDQIIPFKQTLNSSGGAVTLNLHVFTPPGHQPSDSRPAIVFFFGGGWVEGSASHFHPQCEYLASRGMVAISAEYRVKNLHGTTPQECVKDGKSAIRYVRQHAATLGIDPNRIAAGGGSAGGHVAAAAGTLASYEEAGENLTISSRPDALVIYNGVVDNGPGPPVGYGYSTVQAYWQSISPLHNITATAPPTVFFLGTSDALVPVSVGENYQSAMETVGRRCDLHLYQDQPHSFFNFDVPTDSSGPFYGYRDTLFKTDEFLVSLGYLSDPHDAPVPATGWVTLSGDAAFSAGSAATASPVTTDADGDCIAANFAPVTLTDGAFIRLTGTVTLNAPLAGDSFRIGLFDGDNPATAGDGSGYAGIWAGAPATTATSIVSGNGTAASHPFENTGTTTLGPVPAASTALPANTPLDFSLMLARNGTKLDIAVNFTDHGTYHASQNLLNIASANFTYDSAAFLLADTLNATQAAFSNIAITRGSVLPSSETTDASSYFWDADGDTTANTGGVGVWQTANTWREESATGTLQNWADGTSPYRSAVFGGTWPTTILNVDVQSNVTVNQLKFVTGGNGYFYNIGRTTNGAANSVGSITFGGSYDSTTPAIDASTLTAAGSATISAKLSGTPAGGLVIKASSNLSAGYSNTSVGRIYLRSDAANNDFTGDVTLLGGSLDLRSHLGNASNKVILAGGGLISLTAASATTTTFSLARDIEVTANSAIGSWAGNSGTNRTVVVDLAPGKTLSGSANLTRYLSTTAIGSGNKEEVRLSGGMSGFTGTYENHGGVTVIQTTATSAGTWKSTGGTLQLNTTQNTHIADGPGKSDLLMNGGTLDLNGKNETINGLSGSTGTLQNQLAATTSTLTLGAGDATASFGGILRNHSGTGGTLALTKTGSGTQTLAGTNLHTGNTTVLAGKLILATTGSLRFIPTTNGLSNQLTGPGTADLNGSFDIDLTTADPTPGNEWPLVDVATTNYHATTFTVTGFTESPEGTWKKADGANLWIFTQSTGTLKLLTVGTYAAWAGDHAANQPADLDYDHDGLKNGIEYFLNATTGGFTANPSSFTANTATWNNGGNIPSTGYGTRFYIQTAPDLVNWTKVLDGNPFLNNTAGSVSYTLNGTGKQFVRLVVVPD